MKNGTVAAEATLWDALLSSPPSFNCRIMDDLNDLPFVTMQKRIALSHTPAG
jgi:hypothetical protein